MQDRPALAAAVRSVLRPLVRILLRNKVDVWTLVEAVKQIYVDVAAKEFAGERKPSVSRVSLLTGLTRKEVSRLWEQGEAAGVDSGRYSRAANVIGGWLRSPGFQDANRDPRELPLDGARGSFAELVRRFGADVTPRALLDELVEAGAVERMASNRVRLLTRGYVPRTDDGEKLGILGTDVADLISSVDHNIVSPPEQAFFQRKVAYDNLVAACLPELRDRAARRGQTLLEALDEFMAAHDRDANPSVAGEGRHRAVIGIYYYEEPAPRPDSEGEEDA